MKIPTYQNSKEKYNILENFKTKDAKLFKSFKDKI